MTSKSNRSLGAICGVASLLLAAPAAWSQLTGQVKINGSSTVAPIANATAQLFNEAESQVQVTVGISGTGGGFKKFLDQSPDLRTDINNASRHIKASELELAAKHGVEFVELPIAMDGLAIMVNPKNSFCDHLTLEELKRIWEPGSTINNWSQIRAGFPDKPLKLFGPGPDSGTFDYFTEVVVGKEKACRPDYTASENDNALVIGIAGDEGALGYFGFAYYEANKAKLKLLAVDNGDGQPLKPSIENIRDGSYRPLARPLFMYISRRSLDRPEVNAYVSFFFKNARKIVEHPRVQYVSLPDDVLTLAMARFQNKTTGSVFGGQGAQVDRSLAELYGKAE